MLNFLYPMKDDIPENSNGGCKAENGKAEPKKSSENHPVPARSKQLINEKSIVENELNSQKAEKGGWKSGHDADYQNHGCLEANPLKEFHCRNRSCRETLGKTDNQAFFFLTPNGFYGKLQVRHLDIICYKCRRRTRWVKIESERILSEQNN